VLATRLGAAAVDSLAAGRHGVLLGVLRGEIMASPLAEIAGRMRPADAGLCELARMLAL
jgi:6-phosphofructokinase 1